MDLKSVLMSALTVVKSLLVDHVYRVGPPDPSGAPSKASEKGKTAASAGKVEFTGLLDGVAQFKIQGNHGDHTVLVSTNRIDPWMRINLHDAAAGKTTTKHLTPATKDEASASYLEWSVYHFLREQKVALGLTDVPADALDATAEMILKGNLLLVGPTGSGKTWHLHQTIKERMADWLMVEVPSGSEGLTDVDLLQATIVENGNLQMVPGPLHNAFFHASWGKKVVFYIDEINRMSTKAMNVFVGAMNRRPDGTYLLYNHLLQQWLKAPVANLRFVSSINRGSGYSGTNQMDAALMGRFDTVDEFDYMEASEESALLVTASGIAKSLADKLVRVAASVREAVPRIPVPLDTRSLIAWSKFLADKDGMDAESGIYPLDTVLRYARLSWMRKCVKWDALTGKPQPESMKALEDFIRAVFPPETVAD